MVQDVLAADPLLRVFLDQVLHEGYGILGDAFRELQDCLFNLHLSHAYIQDFLHCFLSADMIERSLTHQQLIGQHAQTPQIDSIVILSASQNLRRGIIESPTVGLPPLIADRSPAEVTQLADPLNEDRCTCDMTIFSGLISRWAI